MVRFKPEALASVEVLAKCPAGEKVNLVGLTHDQHRVSVALAEKFKMSVGDFLRATSVRDSGVEIPGQENRFSQQAWVATFTVDLESIDPDVRRFIERQAQFREQNAREYLSFLICRGLAEDEGKSIVDPDDGSVIARKDEFGTLFKTTKAAVPAEQPVRSAA